MKFFVPLLLPFVLCTSAAAQKIPVVKMADVVQRMNQPNDTTYIINFWATFCKPCVEEMPGFLKVAEKYKSQKVKLILVSLDLPSYYPKRIADFVTKNKWKASIAWLNETNADYFCPMIDSSWSGAIPATVIVNAKRGYKKFWEGEVREEGLENELEEALGLVNGGSLHQDFRLPLNNIIEAKYFDQHNQPVQGRSFYRAEFSSVDSTVYAVLDGEVLSVIYVDTIQVVMIQKANWLYCYSNLKTVLVKKRDKVKERQIIGYAANDIYVTVPKVDLYFSDIEKEMKRNEGKKVLKK